ncbi:hypothetical protein K0U91_08385 [Chryseobacterium chendengshani]|uniref:hypothetical protein n=1 Tax=Chryseobacterium sp. LJ668 TaxID=2864040 RepID=UPI001C72E5CD|nr:hypothetical protein [Chryseobacterium sp. LJ668]QYK15107.1 hypothetical protein K0U91_08385 [Chryseobacterium sp. LJ668]
MKILIKQKIYIYFVSVKSSLKEYLVSEKEKTIRNKTKDIIGKKLSFVFDPINIDSNAPRIKYP